MITVHHLNNSRSQRVLWMLEELGLEYEIKRYERDKKTMLAPPELKAVHPLGKSPVITDGDKTLAESGAILEYLVSTYGKGKFIPPENSPERLRYTFWMHYAEGSLMPPLLMTLIFNKIETSPMPFFIKPVAKGISAKVKSSFINPTLKTHLDFVEAELGKSPWFAGEELTAADVQMSFPMEGAAARDRSGSSRPRSAAFLDRVHARPAYKTALEKGGPFTLG
ncbi:MAG: glutathione S-transferase [Polyangiaceae bacterium]